FPQALTGILDETGARWGSFAYDTQGRAISTQLAGAVSSYQVSYPSTGSATVIDPLGTSRNYSYGTAAGKLAVTSGSLPSGEGEPDAASRVQDANGLVTSETDFKGVKTTTTWDTVRRLPLTVVRAAGTPEAQTTTTQWHPTFSLPALVSESGRSTAYTYDTAGRLLSEAITDTLVSPATTKTRSWTWNAQGLVATATEPNGGVTNYTYDASGNALSYHPPTGRYTQPDPIGLAGSFIDTDPVNPFYKTSLWFDPSSAAGGGINRFIYGNGNPLSFIDPDGLQAEHTKNARPSTEQKHQDAEARRQRDAGGEKGDQRRRPPSKRPPGYKGPWPIPGIIPLICPLCEVMEPQPLPGPELCQGPSERRES
ncbi:MAG: RHS repeat protein, partial [Proteobacteria bacterium]